VTVPRALLLVLALLQAAGVLDVVRRATCEAACRSDGCDGDGAPVDDCPQCPCHCPSSSTLAAPGVTAVAIGPATHLAQISFGRADRRPSSPDPREILHVPRQRA
jgi:hypothetical protein